MLGVLFNPENGTDTSLRNVNLLAADFKALYP
jgi:hypothetical protein